MPLPSRKEKLKRNIRKFYFFRVLSSLFLVAPIFVLFLLESGLSITKVMFLQALYTAIMMVFTVPAGLLADKIGRKQVLIYSSFLYALGWLIYAHSYTFPGFLAAETLLAFSNAFWLAGGTSFFYDTLKELKQEHLFKRLYGNIVSLTYLGGGLAALIGGYLATYSLRWPFWFSIIPAGLALLIALTFTETLPFPHGERRYLTHLKNAIHFTAQHPKVRLFLLYSALLFALGFAVYMLYQPYFQAIKVPLAYFGFLYFLLSMVGAAGSQAAHFLESKLGERKILLTILLLTLLSLFGMSALIPGFGIFLPLVISFFSGVLEPVITDYINKHVESYHRATVNSLGSLLMEFFSTLTTPFLGWLVDFWSLGTAFFIAGIILLIDLGILLVAFYLLKK